MSKLTIEETIKIADLAKIQMSESEAVQYQTDINNILSHLSSISGSDADPTQLEQMVINNTRNDILEPRDFDTKTIFSNIPDKSKDNYVKVSKVIKK